MEVNSIDILSKARRNLLLFITLPLGPSLPYDLLDTLDTGKMQPQN